MGKETLAWPWHLWTQTVSMEGTGCYHKTQMQPVKRNLSTLLNFQRCGTTNDVLKHYIYVTCVCASQSI